MSLRGQGRTRAEPDLPGDDDLHRGAGLQRAADLERGGGLQSDAHLPGETEAVLSLMRLIWAVDHELERVSKRMEARLGLTIPQRMTLLLVRARPGILASELAERLHLHRATMSGIVRRLVRAGYLETMAHGTDRRRIGLTVTGRGRAVLRRRVGTFEEAVRRVLVVTRADERAATEVVLRRLGVELRALADGADVSSPAISRGDSTRRDTRR